MTLVVVAAGCAGLLPQPVASPPSRLQSFLAGDISVFTAVVRPVDSLDLSPTAALAMAAELQERAAFQLPPDPPIYGALACPKAPMCPDWFGGRDPVSVWLVWYPGSESFVFIDAESGRMLRACETVRGSGESSCVI
jgi:hypothetical protein